MTDDSSRANNLNRVNPWASGSDPVSKRISQYAFFGVSALIFVVSLAVTIIWCGSMSSMDMPMPGGWTMSMAWMRMGDQTWPGAAAMFIGMWVVMMAPMMLPSLIPMLHRYRQSIDPSSRPPLGWLTTVVGLGYFFVWTVFGIAVYPVGVLVAEVEMRQPAISRAVPFAIGLVILIAGLFQLSPWKARHLSCCRENSGASRTLGAGTGTAWRHGIQLGLHCCCCCAGPMVVLLVIGVMDLRAMAVVGTAITVERLAPAANSAARTTGAIAIVAGLILAARAAWIG